MMDTKDVFVSYAHEDEAIAKAVVRFLKAAGYSTWFDKDDLLGGETWEKTIPIAIKSSKTVLLLLSTNSVGKRGFVQAEMRLALKEAMNIPDGDVFIIPARLNTCERPDSISHLHILDLFENGELSKLLESIQSGLDKSFVNPPAEAWANVEAALKGEPATTPHSVSALESGLSPTAQKILNEIRNDTRSESKGMMIALHSATLGFYLPYLWDNNIHGGMSAETGSMVGVKLAIRELESAGFLHLLEAKGAAKWYALTESEKVRPAVGSQGVEPSLSKGAKKLLDEMDQHAGPQERGLTLFLTAQNPITREPPHCSYVPYQFNMLVGNGNVRLLQHNISFVKIVEELVALGYLRLVREAQNGYQKYYALTELANQ